MNGRVIMATRLGFREQARRPFLVVLLVVLPFFFITRAIAATKELPRRVGLPGGSEVFTTMRALHGVSMAAITVAFLSGLCGAFIVSSARQADRRLVVAGFRPAEAMLPRLAVLGAATVVVLATSLVVTALSFTPRSWLAFAAGTLPVGLTYACIGVIAGAVLGQLGATYLVLFLAMLGTGILQDPMFGSGTPGGIAVFFPDYGANRVAINGGFSSSFQAWGDLILAVGWLVVLIGVVVLVLRRLLRSRMA